jgi:hypothetical protein
VSTAAALAWESFDDRVTIDASAKGIAPLADLVGDTIKRYGLVRVKRAVAPSVLENCVDQARLIAERFDAFRKGSLVEDALRENYPSANVRSFAVPVDEMAGTGVRTIGEFGWTELIRAVVGSPLGEVFLRLGSYRYSFQNASIRLAFPLIAEGGHPGGLNPHIEHTNYPGAHVLWMPLVKPGVICNYNTPGVGYLVRDRPPKEMLEDTLEQALGAVDRFSAFLQGNRSASLRYTDEAGFMSCMPSVEIGDALIFDSLVPHYSNFPPDASHYRANLDVRFHADLLEQTPPSP